MASDEATNVAAETSKTFTVSVEGNIGSGKSTLLKYFEDITDVETFPEPVESWRNVRGHNMLDLLYKDPQRWGGAFQAMVQLTRFDTRTKPTSARVRMIERSLQNNRSCFFELGKTLGTISEPDYAVLSEFYDFLSERLDVGLDLIVYLRTSPEVAYQRLLVRHRPEEECVPKAYLEALHNAYENWLSGQTSHPVPAPVLILDANQDIDGMRAQYELHRSRILNLNETRDQE